MPGTLSAPRLSVFQLSIGVHLIWLLLDYQRMLLGALQVEKPRAVGQWVMGISRLRTFIMALFSMNSKPRALSALLP